MFSAEAGEVAQFATFVDLKVLNLAKVISLQMSSGTIS